MSTIIHIPNEKETQTRHQSLFTFKNDVKDGLEASSKYLHSRYFYDESGSDLFTQITKHPDYYLTNCEIEILHLNKSKLSELMHDTNFNLIELGPGEGIKPKILIEQFSHDSHDFRYTPIDISASFLQTIIKQFQREKSSVKINPIHADYFDGLAWQSSHSERKNLALFLGSSIGNFDMTAAEKFLRHIWSTLNNGDYLLIGFDLRKDIDILMKAYNDSKGITREFNLNLLARINRELAANFNLSRFQHYPTYNVQLGAMESYLVSLKKQTVTIDTLGKSFEFDAIEPIHVEYSFKYSLTQINSMAQQTGFRVIENFSDSKRFFVDALWQVNK